MRFEKWSNGTFEIEKYNQIKKFSGQSNKLDTAKEKISEPEDGLEENSYNTKHGEIRMWKV